MQPSYLEQQADLQNLDEPTKGMANELLKFYFEEKPIAEEKIYVPVAIYVASQITMVSSVSGDKRYGNGVTLTQIIRSLDHSVDVERFFEVLGQFLNSVKSQVPDCLQYKLSHQVDWSSMSFRIYKKFDKCLSHLGIKRLWNRAGQIMEDNDDKSREPSTPIFPQDPQVEQVRESETWTLEREQKYISLVKNLAWLLFLMLRKDAQCYSEENSSLVSHPDSERTELLIAHLTLVVLALPEGFTCNHFLESDKFSQKVHRQEEISLIIRQIAQLVASQFQASEGFEEDINQRMNQCKDWIQKIRSDALQEQRQSDSYVNLFDDSLISGNFRKFHTFYERQFVKAHTKEIHLDEECFLRQKLVFTPYKKVHHNETQENEEPPIEKKIKTNTEQPIKVPPRKQSADIPLFQQTPYKANLFTTSYQQLGLSEKRFERQALPSDTPISQSMIQNQWLKKHTQRDNNNTAILEEFMRQISPEFAQEFNEKAQSIIMEYLNSTDAENTHKETVCQQILKFYLKVLEKLINVEFQKMPETIPNLLQNHQFINALLAIVIETRHYIIKKKEANMDKLLEICQITSVEFWRIISNFANFHENMPQSITQHLFDLENKVLLYWIWQDQYKAVHTILKKKKAYTNRDQQMGQLRFYENVLFKRLSQHLALRVAEVAAILGQDDQIKDSVWEVLQKFLENPPEDAEILKQKHMDVFVVCTFYMILKKKQKNPQFKKFQEAYLKTMPQDQTYMVFKNLVVFYNDQFLKDFRDFLPPKQQNPLPGENKQFNLFQSPIRQVFPSPLVPQSPYVNSHLRAPSEQIYQFGSPQQQRLQLTFAESANYRHSLATKIRTGDKTNNNQ